MPNWLRNVERGAIELKAWASLSPDSRADWFVVAVRGRFPRKRATRAFPSGSLPSLGAEPASAWMSSACGRVARSLERVSPARIVSGEEGFATTSENAMGGGLRDWGLRLGEGRCGHHAAGERRRQSEAQKRPLPLLFHVGSPSLVGRCAPSGARNRCQPISVPWPNIPLRPVSRNPGRCGRPGLRCLRKPRFP